MKNYLFVLTILLFGILFSNVNKAQSFTFQTDQNTVNGNPGSLLVINVPLVNISSDTLSFYINRRVNDLPGGWTSSMCFGLNCFPAELDSVATTPYFGNHPAAPGDTVDFSLDFFTDSTILGTGHVKLVAKNMSNPSDSIVIDLYGSTQPTSVGEESGNPNTYSLSQNYPNPFNPSTMINFSLAKSGYTTLKIYDVLGKEVKTLIEGYTPAGNHSVNFSALNLASGLYFYRLKSGNYTDVKKMILMK